MKKLKVLLALITEANDYQREQASVGHATAARLGIDLEVIYANSDAIRQTKQLLAALHAPPAERPDAVIVEPVGTAMPQVAHAAVHNKVGWILLGRDVDYVAALRQHTSVPVASVDTNNLEVGRLQGRQFAALLPNGGKVWYIEGPATDVSTQRRKGLEDTLPSNVELVTGRGRWTEESGYTAISSRLQLEQDGRPGVALIGSQNDAMAAGARKAVEAHAAGPFREDWLRIPLAGVDGVPAAGQAWVKQGLLACTVVNHALSGIALELLAKSVTTGSPVPERTLSQPTSFPPLEKIAPRAGR